MQVSVHEAKTHLSRLLEAVERGERVIITRHSVPAAELVPAHSSGVRIGSLKGKVPPPAPAVFAPMDDDELQDWGA